MFDEFRFSTGLWSEKNIYRIDTYMYLTVVMILIYFAHGPFPRINYSLDVVISLLSSVDGSERKPRMINVDNEEEKGNQKVEDAFDVKPTPPSDKKKTLQMKKDEKLLISSPSLERLKLKVSITISNFTCIDNCFINI